MVDDEGVIRFDEASHDSEGILVDLFLFFVDLLDLQFGLVGVFVFGHVVEVGGLE